MLFKIFIILQQISPLKRLLLNKLLIINSRTMILSMKMTLKYTLNSSSTPLNFNFMRIIWSLNITYKIYLDEGSYFFTNKNDWIIQIIFLSFERILIAKFYRFDWLKFFS